MDEHSETTSKTVGRYHYNPSANSTEGCYPRDLLHVTGRSWDPEELSVAVEAFVKVVTTRSNEVKEEVAEECVISRLAFSQALFQLKSNIWSAEELHTMTQFSSAKDIIKQSGIQSLHVLFDSSHWGSSFNCDDRLDVRSGDRVTSLATLADRLRLLCLDPNSSSLVGLDVDSVVEHLRAERTDPLTDLYISVSELTSVFRQMDELDSQRLAEEVVYLIQDRAEARCIRESNIFDVLLSMNEGKLTAIDLFQTLLKFIETPLDAYESGSDNLSVSVAEYLDLMTTFPQIQSSIDQKITSAITQIEQERQHIPQLDVKGLDHENEVSQITRTISSHWASSYKEATSTLQETQVLMHGEHSSLRDLSESFFRKLELLGHMENTTKSLEEYAKHLKDSALHDEELRKGVSEEFYGPSEEL